MIGWGDWLIIIGAIFLAGGLICAFYSTRSIEKEQGEGMGVLMKIASEPGSKARKETERNVKKSKSQFLLGLAATVFGIILQTVGSLMR